MPGPRNASAFAISAWTSEFVSPTMCPKKPITVAYATIRPSRSATTAVPSCDRLAQLAAAVVTMHTLGKAGCTPPDPTCARDVRCSPESGLDRRPLHRGYRLTRVKPELGVKRKRPVVKGRLQQAGALETAFRGARQHRFHKRASNALILNLRIDGNRPNARNRRALVKTVAAQYLPARFGNHAIETGMSEHHQKDTRRHLDRRKVGRESVLGRNLRKSLIADPATDRGILRPGFADCYR